MSNIENYENLLPSRGEKFRQRLLPFLALAAICVIIPMFNPSRTIYTLISIIGINIVFALSYNMLLGKAGLLSFGHAVYFGLGGYFCIHAMGWIEAGTGIWKAYPMFMLPLLGFGAGAAAGAVIGWPSCRRAGTPFAMISLGVAELIAAAGFMFDSLFGGEEGISGDRMNGVELFGLSLGPLPEVYIFIAFWTVVGVIGMFAFTRTPLGKLSEATRDNDQRVQFIGYNPLRVRYLVFIVSGGFAGLAGGMAAVNYEIFTPESLSLIPSGFVLIMAYVGGITYFVGPILGAILLTYMQSMMSDFTEAWLLYLGILFIFIVMFAPRGLAGILFDFTAGLRSGNIVEALGKSVMKIVGGILVLLGTIVLVEVAVRWSNGYGESFEPFGMHLGHGNVLTWILIIVPIAAGVALLRYLGREKEEKAK